MSTCIDDLTIGQVKELTQLAGLGVTRPPKQTSLVIGEAYLFRTVTYFYTGRLKAITDTDLVLSDAAWVADTGRYAAALTSGEFVEVEPYPDEVILQRAAIVDACAWSHTLPRFQR